MPINFMEERSQFSSTITSLFDEIYAITHKQNLREWPILKHKLQALHALLFNTHREGNQAPIQANQVYADDVFSQFLQHLLLEIACYNDPALASLTEKESYINGMFLSILNEYSENFYAFIKSKHQIITWFDVSSGDTALTLACKLGNPNIVKKLVDLLISKFNQSTPGSRVELKSSLLNYFFHENNRHFTAWNIAWLEKNFEIHQIFIEFGHKLRLNSIELNNFLLQKDAQGNSVLFKAVKGGDLVLLQNFLDKINQVYKGKIDSALPFFLNDETNGVKVFNLACSLPNLEIVKLLQKAALKTFTLKTDLALFLNSISSDNKKNSALIAASKAGYASIVSCLERFARHQLYHSHTPQLFFNFINHEDSAGYTALMRSIELHHKEVSLIFIRICDSRTFELSEYARKIILAFESSKKITALEIAIKFYNLEIFTFLIYSMDMLDSRTTSYDSFINHRDAEGVPLLNRVIIEENKLLNQMRQEGRVEFTEQEKNECKIRKIIAHQLINYDANPTFARANAPEGWTFLQITKPSSSFRVLSFFSLFCSTHIYRKKRGLNTPFCRFNKDDYLPSLSLDKPLNVIKESLFSAHLFIQQAPLNSLNQVSVIRNQAFISDREIQALARFDQAVNQHYLEQGSNLLTRLKKNTALNLEEGLKDNVDYVLIDSMSDLLILSKEKFFSPLLNPAQAFEIVEQAQQNTLLIEQWLQSYFSKIYTVHPFNRDAIQPLEIEKYLPLAITSDQVFLSVTIEGVSRILLQELFILDGKTLQTMDMERSDFFHTFSKLFFRSERFHKIFFDLTLQEKSAFKSLMLKYPILAQTDYEGLNDAEKKYLERYGSRVIHLIRHTEVNAIDPSQLLGISIKAHERILVDETGLKLSDKRTLINSLEAFKTRLQTVIKTHHKAALQLLVFSFPSVIRSIAERDPLQMAIPLGLMASDIALNQLLVRLTKHPKMLELFAGKLSSKLLAICNKLGERVPVLGSALAVYGLVESGKALVQSPKEDPNHHYYLQLLLNNLATIGVMGAEVAFALPFWPVLGVFTALTVHQVEVGGAIKAYELHLHDDEGHPGLTFYRRMELGVGIVDEQITTVLEQRELLAVYLDYFSRLQSDTAFYAIMAITLPEGETVADYLVCSRAEGYDTTTLLIYPNLPYPSHCKKQSMRVQKKRKYDFELGRTSNICQKVDALNLSENYTLLTGSFAQESQIPWNDCVAGHKKISYGLASAEGEAVAGLVIDNQAPKHAVDQASIFLMVDPASVTDYTFTFKAGTNESPQQGDFKVDSLLPCAHPLSYCVEKVVVAITRFYLTEAIDITRKTKISIDNRELVNLKNSRSKELTYLIRYSDNLSLEGLGITKQNFLFFNETRVFQFEKGKLKTEQGFEANLSEIINLRLEFSNTSSAMGYFEAIEDQAIIINRLQGLNRERKAILNTTAATNYAVGLCANSRFINKKLQLDIESDNNQIVVNGHGVEYTKPFYQLMHPINNFFIDKRSDSLLLRLRNANVVKTRATIHLRVLDPLAPVNIDFNGRYFLEGKSYICRIIVNKLSGYLYHWISTLQIDINTIFQDELNLTAIQASNFDKLTLVSMDDKPSSTHYIFLQKVPVPEIEGNFTRLAFMDHEAGVLPLLSHADNKIQTFLILNKNQEKISINKIVYTIDWLYYSIWATLTHEENKVTDARQLLAPLAINVKSDEVNIKLVNASFKLGNITLIHVPPKLKIKFQDTTLPISLIAYSQLVKDLQEKPSVAFFQAKPAPTNRESAWGFLSATVVAVLTGVGFLWVKRFLRTRPPTLVISGAVVAPLLNAGEVETLAIKNLVEQNDAPSFSKLAYLNSFFETDFNQLNSQAVYKKGLTEFWDKTNFFSKDLLLDKIPYRENKWQASKVPTQRLEAKRQAKKIPTQPNFVGSLNQVHFNEQATLFFYVVQSFKKKFYHAFKCSKKISVDRQHYRKFKCEAYLQQLGS